MWEYTEDFYIEYQPFPSDAGEVCRPRAALLLGSAQLRRIFPNLSCHYTTFTCSCSSSSYPWQTRSFHSSATVWKIKPPVMTKPLLPFPNHSISITILTKTGKHFRINSFKGLVLKDIEHRFSVFSCANRYF